MNIIEVMESPDLFGDQFADESWDNWKALLKAIFCLPMTDSEIEFFKSVSGNREPPDHLIPEIFLLAGRRSGKSRVASLLATWRASFFDYAEHVSPGEPVTVGVCSHTRESAGTIMSYVRAFLEHPAFAEEVQPGGLQRERFLLSNGITIKIDRAATTTSRGLTVPFWIFEESSFFKSSERGINTDVDCYNAVLPSMSSVPNAMLMSISTPYAAQGLNWQAHRDSFGQEDEDRLVLVCPTTSLNPKINRSIIDRQVKRDAAAAASEWILDEANPFRRDIGTFLDLESIEQCIETDCPVRAPQEGVQYYGFFDASGGRADSSVLCISSHQDGRAQLDCIFSRDGKHDPREAIKSAANICEQYGIRTVTGDRYSAEFCSRTFNDLGIQYVNSKLSKSEIYLEALPLFMAGAISILDNPVLTRQLGALERRTGTAKDSVSHPPGGRDDHANACCGALLLTQKPRGFQDVIWLQTGPPERGPNWNPFGEL